jgi:DNA-directed RNA polymerase subunit E'/Rpb7
MFFSIIHTDTFVFRPSEFSAISRLKEAVAEQFEGACLPEIGKVVLVVDVTKLVQVRRQAVSVSVRSWY